MATDVPTIIVGQQTYATNWAAQAQSFLDTIANLANQEFVITIPDGLGFEVVNDTSGIAAALTALKPTPPDLPPLNTAAAPDVPTFTFDELPAISIPEFTAANPDIQIPQVPDTSLPSVPSAPSISDPVIPAAPSIDFPTAPIITAISLPTPPSIEIPPFTASAPIDDLVTPTNVFAYAEQAYEDALLDATKAKLLTDIENGGYGIEPDDEQALFERARAREMDTMLAEMDTVLDSFSQRGFPVEPGESYVMVARAAQRAYDKVGDMNRQIVLERSRLYVENRQFTIREVRELQTVLIAAHTALMERTLNASKATLDAGIAIFNTQVARYNARVTAYQAEAAVFESRIRAATSQLEQYRVEVQAAGLQLDVQRAAVDIYRAQLSGIQSVVDIYRARLEAANVQAGVDRTRIDAFRGLIDAYAQQVQAKVAQMNMYEAQVRGQIARVDAFRAEADAYRAVVDGKRAASDINIAKLNAQVEESRGVVALFQANTEAYRTNIDTQVKVIQNLQETYRTDVTAYGTAVEAIRAAYEFSLKQRETNVQWNLGVQESKVKVALANLERLKSSADVRLKAATVGEAAYQALIATTLGSITTLAAQISSS